MAKLNVSMLTKENAHQLAPLIAYYAQEQNRGAPRRPDEYYADRLLDDAATLIVGGFLNNELIGLCIAYDLPDTITGMRNGQIADIYVKQPNRGQGVGDAMMNTLILEGRVRGWVDLRVIVSPEDKLVNKFFQRFAKSDKCNNFLINIDKLVRRG